MMPSPITYHRATSYERAAMDAHALDWANQPNPYKIYDGLEGVGLPDVADLPAFELPDVYGEPETKQNLDLESLSGICFLAAGLTARSRQGAGWFYFRSNPSAGALYPNELYFAAFATAGLEPGIYHVGAHNRRLSRIREGLFARQLAEAIPGLPENCAGVFVISGIFFRSAWKYRKRAYRYLLLDGGHLAENLRLAAGAWACPAKLHGAFADDALDQLLGLDPRREGSLCCVSVSGGAPLKDAPPGRLDVLSPSVPAAGRVSPSEVMYPEISAIHAAAKIVRPMDSLEMNMMAALGIPDLSPYMAVSPPERSAFRLNYPASVLGRRSKRNFISGPMSIKQLHCLLSLMFRCVHPGLAEDPAMRAAVTAGFIAGNIAGLEPGFYVVDPLGNGYGKAASGDLTGEMAEICLNQSWLKNAGIQMVFLTNLERLDEGWGARGYRYAMLTAGRMGHAVYLGATALGLGCCGIGAFYDGEARDLLKMNAESAMLYLVAAGRVKG